MIEKLKVLNNDFNDMYKVAQKINDIIDYLNKKEDAEKEERCVENCDSKNFPKCREALGKPSAMGEDV